MLPIKNASTFQLFASWTLAPSNFFWNSSSSNVYELANFSLTSRPQKKKLQSCRNNVQFVESHTHTHTHTHTSKIGKPSNSLIKRTHISRPNESKFRCLPHNFSLPFLALLVVRSPTNVATDIPRCNLRTNMYQSLVPFPTRYTRLLTSTWRRDGLKERRN
jgi:hypothetical protein